MPRAQAASQHFSNCAALWSPADCEGFASKRSRGVKSWNHRFFVLRVRACIPLLHAAARA